MIKRKDRKDLRYGSIITLGAVKIHSHATREGFWLCVYAEFFKG